MALTDEQRAFLRQKPIKVNAGESEDEARNRIASGFRAACQLEGDDVPEQDEVLAALSDR